MRTCLQDSWGKSMKHIDARLDLDWLHSFGSAAPAGTSEDWPNILHNDEAATNQSSNSVTIHDIDWMNSGLAHPYILQQVSISPVLEPDLPADQVARPSAAQKNKESCGSAGMLPTVTTQDSAYTFPREHFTCLLSITNDERGRARI